MLPWVSSRACWMLLEAAIMPAAEEARQEMRCTDAAMGELT